MSALALFALDGGAQAQTRVEQAPREPSRTEEARELFLQAKLAYRDGRLREARAQLERAKALHHEPELDFNLGRICERMGENAAAIAYFREYLKAELNDGERAKIEKRIAKLARASEQEPLQTPTASALKGEARRFFVRGQKLFRRGQYQAALAAFAAARRYAPEPELTYDLALTSERLELRQDAVDFYRAYLEQAPNARDAAEVRARIAALVEGRPASAKSAP